jgi:hypothetical protein
LFSLVRFQLKAQGEAYLTLWPRAYKF